MRPRSSRVIRVLVVDDNDAFADALTRLLEADLRIEVVGRAANGKEAIRLVTELLPDIVTMDLEMPVMNGAETIRALASMPSFAVPIIVVSTSESGDLLDAALDAGADAYIPRHGVFQGMVAAVVAL